MKIPEIIMVETVHQPGSLAKVLQVIAAADLTIDHLQALRRDKGRTVWEITLEMDEEADRSLYDRIDALPGVRFVGKSDRVFDLHRGGTLILKRRPVPVPTTVLTAWQMLIISVPIVAGAFLLGDGQWSVPSGTSILVIVYITLVPICLGNVIWFEIVGMLPANVAGLSPIMVPVVALVSGAVIRGEPFGPVQWVAMACCVASLSLALLKPAAGRVG